MPEKPAVKSSPVRGARDTVVGVVTSAKMAKTITVSVERFVQDRRFGKFLKRSTTCYAHDEKGEAKQGDRVEIASTRPLSKMKRWRLVRVVTRGPGEPGAKPEGAASGAPAPAKG